MVFTSITFDIAAARAAPDCFANDCALRIVVTDPTGSVTAQVPDCMVAAASVPGLTSFGLVILGVGLLAAGAMWISLRRSAKARSISG